MGVSGRIVSNVVYWIRGFAKRIGGARLSILAATAAFVVMPFWLVQSNTTLNSWLANRAMASSVAAVKLGQQLEVMTEKQKARHVQALRGLLFGDPGRLKSLNSEDVILSFSSPDLRRRDGSMQIWQYRTENCVLDIFFLDNNEEKKAAITHYEIRPRDRAYLAREGKDKAERPVAVNCIKAISSGRQRA